MDAFDGLDSGMPGNGSDTISHSVLVKLRVFHAGVVRRKSRDL